MITDGWLTRAVRRDMPATKHGYGGFAEPGHKYGLVVHSMEGSLTAALGELDNPDRRASWTFSNPKVGPLIQHAPLGWHTWASGSLEANTRFASCEHEGKVGDPLTQSQQDNLVYLITAIHDDQQWAGYNRPISAIDKTAQLYEHRECIRFGSAPTACPSDRIPWLAILDQIVEEIPVSDVYLNRNIVGRIFTRAASKALAGQLLTSAEKDKIKWLVSQ